ncbi:MAG: hypothetical protein QW039_03635 [Fervidicoccaceae archaeon]
MSDRDLCINVPIYPNLKREFYFTLTSQKLNIAPDSIVLEAEIPSSLIFTCFHAAKAAEEALRAIEQGESLRNTRLEILRRLTLTRQVRDLENIINSARGEPCYVYVTRAPLQGAFPPCYCSEDALRKIFEIVPQIEWLGEEGVLSAIALTSLGRWPT